MKAWLTAWVLRIKIDYLVACIDAEIELSKAMLADVDRSRRARRRLLARAKALSHRLVKTKRGDYV